MTELSDHMGMIIADELRRINEREESDDMRKVVIIEQENVSISSTFIPRDEDDPKKEKQFPVEGKGVLDLLAVRSSSDNFSISLSIDDNDVLDDKSYSTISSLSPDLSRISAYQESGGDYVVTATDYPFHNIVRCSIHPGEQLTLTLVRAELLMGEIIEEDVNEAPTI